MFSTCGSLKRISSPLKFCLARSKTQRNKKIRQGVENGPEGRQEQPMWIHPKETCGPFTSTSIKDYVSLVKGKSHKTYLCGKCASVQEVVTQLESGSNTEMQSWATEWKDRNDHLQLALLSFALSTPLISKYSPYNNIYCVCHQKKMLIWTLF